MDNPPPGNVKYIKINNTTYEVVSHCDGKTSLPDIVKSAIRRDTELDCKRK